VYSRRIIDQKISAFMDAMPADQRWTPVYHSVGQIQDFCDYIDRITKVTSNEKRSFYEIKVPLTTNKQRAIKRWIQNEQILCSVDSSYWETRYGYLCDEKGQIIKFHNRTGQEIFDQVVADLEDREVAIELLILKGRQQGVSLKTALKFLHRMLFRPHSQSVMASAQQEKSELIARVLAIAYEKCPWWLKPRKTEDRVGKRMGWENGSLLSIQSGMQATGIAQGWTPTNIHISELADIPNPQKTLEEGLLRATHSSKYLFQVWEGTGGGNTGYLADKWRAAKEDWPRGRSRLRPMFLSWPLAPDLYPEKDWLKKYPIPEVWQPHQETKKHVRKCELYIQNTDYLARVCGSNWEMPRFQQWFWEFNYDEAVKSHSQRTWMQQMPADDMEALVGKHDRIFDVDVIELHEKSRERDFQAYALISNQIDSGFEPPEDQIDYDLPRIIVQWESHRGQTYEWIMVPLVSFDETNEKNSLDKILIFEHPRKGCDYSVGVDTADGLGNEDEDRSCFSVTRNETDDRQDVQVAEFVSNRVNPAQMVGFVACIGAYYGSYAKDPRGVKFCIEQRDRPGDDCQFQLKLMGFLWHHSNDRIDGKKVREGSSSQHGFMTNAWTRPLLTGRFIEAVNGLWYKPNSKYLIEECNEWERKILASGKTRVDHKSGKHDDRIMSAAMSYFTRHGFDVLADRSAKRYNTGEPSQPILNESMCSDGFLVSVGD
jgi:hypothetical protein